MWSYSYFLNLRIWCGCVTLDTPHYTDHSIENLPKHHFKSHSAYFCRTTHMQPVIRLNPIELASIAIKYITDVPYRRLFHISSAHWLEPMNFINCAAPYTFLLFHLFIVSIYTKYKMHIVHSFCCSLYTIHWFH